MRERLRTWIVRLRWALLLPAAAGCAWLAWALLKFGRRLAMGAAGVFWSNQLYTACYEVFCDAVLGAVFMCAGLSMAPPAHRKKVSRILGGLVALVAVIAGFTSMSRGHYGNIAGAASMLAGALVVLLLRKPEKADAGSAGGSISSLEKSEPDEGQRP